MNQLLSGRPFGSITRGGLVAGGPILRRFLPGVLPGAVPFFPGRDRPANESRQRAFQGAVVRRWYEDFVHESVRPEYTAGALAGPAGLTGAGRGTHRLRATIRVNPSARPASARSI